MSWSLLVVCDEYNKKNVHKYHYLPVCLFVASNYMLHTCIYYKQDILNEFEIILYIRQPDHRKTSEPK